MDLIILQNLSQLACLEQLKIAIEFELDVQISGLLEAIGSLEKLKVLKLNSKKKISGMFFQKEDFQSLFTSLKKLKDLRNIELLLPIQEGTKQNIGSQEMSLLKDFLRNVNSLEMCVIKTRWNLVTNEDIFSLLEVFFQKAWVNEHYEFYFGLRSFSTINFFTILKNLQIKHKKFLLDRQKRGPGYKLIIHTS